LLLWHIVGHRAADGRVILTTPTARRDMVRFVEGSQWDPVATLYSIEILRRA
jgi:hypothetical protein